MRVINPFDHSYNCFQDEFTENITILVDGGIISHPTSDAIAWLIEPNSVLNSYFGNQFDFFDDLKQAIQNGKQGFKRLYTSHKFFSDLPNVVVYENPPIPSWVGIEDCKIYEKSQDLVFVTSSKSFTPSQSKRIEVAKYLLSMGVPVYGRGFSDPRIKEVEKKVSVLAPSRFCVVIENEILDGWHTEKLTDCFRTGTIPLYVGDPSISKLYDSNGMLVFDTVEDLMQSDVFSDILNGNGTKDLYESMIENARENMHRFNQKDYTAKGRLNKILEDFRA